MPNKDFWKDQSFTPDEMPNFRLPQRREDMTDGLASLLTKHFAARDAAVEAEQKREREVQARIGREGRAESWLTRFLNVWNGRR